MKFLMYTCFSIGFALAVYNKDASEAIWIATGFIWFLRCNIK